MMNQLRQALQQLADQITAAHRLVTTLQTVTSSPARLAGLNLIGLYLTSAAQAIRGAQTIIARL